MEIKNLECSPAAFVTTVGIIAVIALFIGGMAYGQGEKAGELKFYREHDKTRN